MVFTINLREGTRLKDGDKTFVYTDGEFVPVVNEFRRIEHRLFLDNKDQVRCWTSDWLTNERQTERENYFVRWVSLKSASKVSAPFPHHMRGYLPPFCS